MTWHIIFFSKILEDPKKLGKILTSKILINLLVQFPKPCKFKKNPILFRKEFPLSFGPAANWPTQPFGPPSVLLPPPAPKQSTQATAVGQSCAAPMAAPDHLR
jgi:hypothetical protein